MVWGSGLECQAAMVQERPRGATPRPRSVAAWRRHPAPRSGAAAGRSYPASEVSGGWEETPRVRGQGQQLGGDTLRLRSGAAGRSHRAPQARGDDPEELPRAQGQGWRPGGATEEWWLQRHRRA